MFIELVRDKLSNRPGECVKKETLNVHRRNARTPLYRSVFTFLTPFEGSVSNYMGDYSIESIVFDIDFTNKKDTLENVKTLVIQLLNDIDIDQIQIFFSGTGFHVQIHADCFGFKDSHDLPAIVKATLVNYSDLIDTSFYNPSGLIRCAHSKNPKTGLHKIPLTWNDVKTKDYDYFTVLARKDGWDYDYSKYNFTGNGELHDYLKFPALSPKGLDSPVIENTRIATCIHNILRNKPQKGKRHPLAMAIASHFRRHGIPSKSAVLTLADWLSGEKDKTIAEIESIVKSAYEVPYVFSCNNALLQPHCSPSCLYYYKKNYGTEVYEADEMHRQTKERMQMDFKSSTLNIDEMFNIHEDHRIYPGELVTIFGLTGSGKTAFAQSLVAGMTVYGNQIADILPTLYMSLEMSTSQMYRRWVQQVKGMTKKEAYKYITENEYLKELSHIRLRCLSPTLSIIEEEIRQYNPKLIIIDHLELVKLDTQFTRNKIAKITESLKQMALKYDIIIIQLSQVSRTYSRENTLDLYAGKESGTIEADSDKVFGLWGKSGCPEKKLEVFKNREAENLEVKYLSMSNYMTFNQSDKTTYDYYMQKNEEKNIFKSNKR